MVWVSVRPVIFFCYRYTPRLNQESRHIADWLMRITDNQKNWGFGL
jgi:putative transposase